MADPDLGSIVTSAQQQFELAGEDWTITIRHGSDPNGGYRLDIDHATETAIAAADIQERLEDFNRRIYQVFRWAISEEMYHEMEPRERN